MPVNICKALVVHSPYSGRSAQLPQTIAELSRCPINIASVIPISDLDGLPDQGEIWKEEGIDTVIAAGGDGLIGGVITHIGDSGLRLGILPLGTANDIARSVGIPLGLPQAIETLCNGEESVVDIGIAQPAEQTPHSLHSQPGAEQHPRSQQHGRFAHTLTLGLNVQFARLATNVMTRQRYGRLTYPVAALEVLKRHEALEIDLCFEGLALHSPQENGHYPGTNHEHITYSEQPVALHCRALQATIINAPIFGGIWQLAIPGASLHDHLLDIVLIEDVELENLGTALTHLFQGQNHTAHTSVGERYPQLKGAELTSIPGIHHIQARSVIISTGNDPQDVTLDGEVRGKTPIRVQQADGWLRVIVPADHARTKGV